MAIVIGPTPPGTGVIYEHLSHTLSKSTSPTIVFFVNLLVPTSIIIASSLILSLVIKSALPTAVINMSASLTLSVQSGSVKCMCLVLSP